MRNGESLAAIARAKGWLLFVNRGSHYHRRNSRTRAREDIAFHYDLGNDFYGVWLDPGMTYSSALFDPVPQAGGDQGEGLLLRDRPSPSPSREREGSLEAAQARKIRALLYSIDLSPGQRQLTLHRQSDVEGKMG